MSAQSKAARQLVEEATVSQEGSSREGREGDMFTCVLPPFCPRLSTRSFTPLVHAMLTFGVVGYSIEYLYLGQYHVAHEKAEIAAALAAAKKSHH